ncbi:GtrA family protein [Nocardioides mesophilus]|uniref:GtrA family protein n=1 Tax=Nocardioides mesophilus TaxID=433659 RepID=A0A7G9RDK1_9ACTN|nr:GtrA family protein [Nocardioides mesophilus]QNN53676.1 GtrA family protein [Nocardioides mesophilus]
MGRRLQRFLGEATKFLTVGGVATLVSLVLFNALVHGYFGGPGPLNDQPLAAFVLANTVGMVVSYRGSRSWAFRNREAVGPAGGRVAFFGINAVSMLIPLGCLAFTRYVLDLADPVSDNIAANGVGLALGTAARFWAIRRFIFRTPRPVEEHGPARPARVAREAGAPLPERAPCDLG